MRVTTISELALAIKTMHYGDFMTVATTFEDMCSDGSGRKPPKTAEDFASLLHDWATLVRE